MNMVGQLPAQIAGPLLQGAIKTRVDVFQEIFKVFLGLGTLVGVIVVSYLLWQGYKYRASAASDDGSIDRPSIGDLPAGADKGTKKLFMSFSMSVLIVLVLISWAYGLLLFVETGQASADAGEAVDVEVTGKSFFWEFRYQDADRLPQGEVDSLIEDHGEEAVLNALQEDDLQSLDEGVETNLTTTSMTIPTNARINIVATAPENEVMHNFGITELKVKTDAMPGETTETWFAAEEEGTYMAECSELCGVGHGIMTTEVEAVSQEEYEQWYQDQTVAKDDLIQQLEAS